MTDGDARCATDRATKTVRSALGKYMVEVRAPGEAEEPILSRSVRGAIHEWLNEIGAGEELHAVGLRARSTCLLYGAPGCGKTTLAHHLSARLGVPLVLIGSEALVSSAMWGEAERNTVKLFGDLAACEVPCVILMDEMESWGGNRDHNKGGSVDNARTALLGVILRKIEEFSGILIGATNRDRDIDPALWRRFGLHVAVDLPGPEEAFAIMKRYLAPYTLPDDDIDLLVAETRGASPALLRALMEGIKRALVLAPRLGRSVASASGVIESIVASVQPPPGMAIPPLWQERAVAELDAMAWPPSRPGHG
jgi:ATP-dependent 26S proteasome regulatory subunit